MSSVSIQNGGTVFACGCIGRRDTRNLQTGGRVRGGGRGGETPHPPFTLSSPPPPVHVSA